MVGIVLASHGKLAEGIQMTGSMVFGEQENVQAVALMPDMGPDDFKAKVQEAVATFPDPEQVLFLVDLWGGTPFNQISALVKDHPTWALVTGLSLPMLVEAYGQRFDDQATAQTIAKHIFVEGRKGVRTFPEDLQPKPKKAAAAAQAPQGAIPEGTVLGDGKIDIALARIDTRLLHGQVATSWTKSVHPDRIIVVSDKVAHDDLRKTMIMNAAPAGVKANVIPIQKMIDVYNDPRFGATRALVLFETPQDALACVKGGVKLEKINVGSMAHSEGKVMLDNANSVDQADVDTFKEMRSLGVEFSVQKVPSSGSSDLWGLIKKAGFDVSE